MVFSPEGRYLVTVSGQDVYILPLDWDELFAWVCERLPRNLKREERNRYIGPEEPCRPTCPNLMEFALPGPSVRKLSVPGQKPVKAIPNRCRGDQIAKSLASSIKMRRLIEFPRGMAPVSR